MKNVLKIFLLAISLVLVLVVSTVPVFATEAHAENSAAESNMILGSYIDDNDHMIIVFADGRQYNVTVGEWFDTNEQQKGIDIKIDPENMLDSLQYMWKGMLCIFVVIGVIILSVYLMNGISARAEAIKASKEENENNE